MNIEELELSLRTEFEGQMKNVVAGIRQDVANFQKNFEAEFQKHREQMDRSLSELSGGLPESFVFDSSFKESLTEHLRLARDEGAQIAANAFGEAEKLRADSPPAAKYDLVRDAIKAISSRSTQATILSSLVEHSALFAPRGAFFIVKNDHLVAWKTFGEGVSADEKAVRDIQFSVESHSMLSEAVGTLSTIQSHYGAHADDKTFLEPLGFGEPEHMYAVPLTARGRGVAVLYVDKGNGGELNVEALETLVRVAGLTVELLAASQTAKVQQESSVPQQVATTAVEQAYEQAYSYNGSEPQAAADHFEEAVPYFEAPQAVEVEQPVVEESVSYYAETVEDYSGAVSIEEDIAAEPTVEYSAEPVQVEESEAQHTPAELVEEQEVEDVAVVEEATYEQPSTNGFDFGSNASFDASESQPETEYVAEEATVVTNGNGHVRAAETVVEPVVEVATVQTVKSRFSERNMDLPIEVADDERRLHNDARRFARLLVSEIKLYNEQRVTEGREERDLYMRLREAIDRSRDMYDKRVQPAVASKFDYFHYELVSNLAEGDVSKLGGGYPGTAA